MKNCPKKQCFISVIALFVFLYAFEYVLNGHVLMGMYNETPQLWRSPEEMAQYAPWFPVRYLLLAMVITCLFKKMCKCDNVGGNTAEASAEVPACGTGKPCCPSKKAVCFGTKIGLLMGILAASCYIWMPISGMLAIAWLVSHIIEGIGIGIVLACVWKKKECCAS